MATLTVGVAMTPELKDLVERAERISSEVRNAAVEMLCSVVRNALADNPKLSEADLSVLTTGAAAAFLVGLSALSPEQPELGTKFEAWCADRSAQVADDELAQKVAILAASMERLKAVTAESAAAANRAAGVPVDDVLSTLQRIESLLLRLSDSGRALRVTAA